MSNVLKVKFKDSYLNEENINNLLQEFESELKINDITNILNQLIDKSMTIQNSKNTNISINNLRAFVEYLSNENIQWPLSIIPNVIFEEDTNLIEIILPDQIEEIEISTFFGCNCLENIILPPNLKRISTHAFRGCSKLKNISLPKTLTELDFACFRECNLFEITIPSSVRIIPEQCFAQCENLKKIKFEEGVQILGPYIFSRSVNVDEIYFPSSIKMIGKDIFNVVNDLTLNDLPTPLIIHTKNKVVIDYFKKNYDMSNITIVD